MPENQQFQIADFKLKLQSMFFESWMSIVQVEQSAIGNLKSSIHQDSAPKNPAQNSGDNSAVVPPVPIPNTEVKRCSPDGSTATGRARVGRRQN